MLKTVLKAALIALGWLLVLGGGVCAASNLYFTLVDPSYMAATGILLLICVVAVLAGWAILKTTGVVKPGKRQQANTD